MDDDAIRDIAAQLEGAAPLDGAKVRIDEHNAGLRSITGTRSGYLRLAAVCLRAAISPPEPPADSFGADLLADEELFAENSAVVLHWTARREDLSEYSFDEPPRRLSDWFYITIYIGVLSGLPILIVIGAITVWKQLFS